ncbi:MAG: protease complex subunit PrcB family protein [Flavobacterium sp.]|nr:MAG: protease complex subunit PrcB family protein [Flavobacterium sp.]
MKKIGGLIMLFIAAASCATKSAAPVKRPLYEILTQQSDGGGNIHFYEIISEPNEIPMLQNDEHLSRKIKADDIKTANFLVLNMGEKTSGGYSITVDNVVETADKIIVTVHENEPAKGSMTTSAITYPYTVVRINSKKPIEVK